MGRRQTLALENRPHTRTCVQGQPPPTDDLYRLLEVWTGYALIISVGRGKGLANVARHAADSDLGIGK